MFTDFETFKILNLSASATHVLVDPKGIKLWADFQFCGRNPLFRVVETTLTKDFCVQVQQRSPLPPISQFVGKPTLHVRVMEKPL